jgi:hypothetical protein
MIFAAIAKHMWPYEKDVLFTAVETGWLRYVGFLNAILTQYTDTDAGYSPSSLLEESRIPD